MNKSDLAHHPRANMRGGVPDMNYFDCVMAKLLVYIDVQWRQLAAAPRLAPCRWRLSTGTVARGNPLLTRKQIDRFASSLAFFKYSKCQAITFFAATRIMVISRDQVPRPRAPMVMAIVVGSSAACESRPMLLR